MRQATLERLLAERDAGRPVALATALDDGTEHLVGAAAADASVPAPLREAAAEALRFDRAVTREIDGRRWLVNPCNPPLRLYVVGAVHIAQSLAPMAAATGMAVTVIDPRRAFATDERFPDVKLDTNWPDEALALHPPDARTAVVTLTHDPKLDDTALAAALRSEAFYIGALGSRRTHANRCERLRGLGFDDRELARIHAPVGIHIGSAAPAEIAVSILAQVISVQRRGE